jgi:hypothetical protein
VPLPEPVPGLIVSYSYLWRSQQQQGREEGTKDRPCVVVLAVSEEEGERVVTVAPVTHAPPVDPRDAIEIPAAVKRRLGLDGQKSWIVATELNRFIWPGPDLRPIPGKPGVFAYGGLPKLLMLHLKERISELHKDRRFRVVRRD